VFDLADAEQSGPGTADLIDEIVIASNHESGLSPVLIGWLYHPYALRYIKGFAASAVVRVSR
jgi:hypothetical protein